MVFEQKDVMMELSRWGMNSSNITYTPRQCEQLYDTLVRNYPCMKEGVCGPYDQNGMSLVIGLLLLIAIGLGFWLGRRKW